MDYTKIDTEAANDGHLISILCSIDENFPCLGRYFRHGPHRRQIIAAALAPTLACGADQHAALARLGAVAPDSDASTLFAAAGQAICQERGADLIRRSYGEIPDNFIGALGRSGKISHGSRYYLELYDVYHLAEHRHIRKVLQHGAIDPRKLRTAIKLPPYLCVPSFLEMASQRNVEDLVSMIELIMEVCPSATTDAITASLTTGDEVSLGVFIARWISRSPLPESPVVNDDVLIPIRTVNEMESLGREMRNCLKSRSVAAISRAKSYLVARIDGAPYIAELIKIHGTWTLNGIFASRNGIVPTHIENELSARLEAHGIKPDFADEIEKDRWEPIRRALRQTPLTAEDFFPFDWID